jgi:hypothetical protein
MEHDGLWVEDCLYNRHAIALRHKLFLELTVTMNRNAVCFSKSGVDGVLTSHTRDPL